MTILKADTKGGKKNMVYAKTMSPELFDYRFYEDDIDERVMIDGHNDYADLNADLIKAARKMYEDYDYELPSYNNSIKAYAEDRLPKRKNGKNFSAQQLRLMKMALDHNLEEAFIAESISAVMCEEYKVTYLKGSVQREWVIAYVPESMKAEEIAYVEAIYFGTGTEVMIHDDAGEPKDGGDVSGYCFYTTKYFEDDLKEEIAERVGCPTTEVVLFMFDGYQRTAKYKRV
jgi:hypothetical protein